MNKSTSSIVRLAVIGGSIVLVIGGLRVAANIVNMVLMAYVVVLLTSPLVHGLAKRRVPLFLSVVLVLAFIVGLFVLVGLFIVLSLRQLEADLPQYQTQLAQAITDLQIWFANLGVELSQLPINSILQSALGTAGKMVSGLTNVVVNLGLILVIVFFALFEVQDMPSRMFQAFSGDNKTLDGLYAVNDGVRKYILLKAVTGAVMGAGNTVLLLVVGVEFAFLWGIFAFLMNFIPNIGFIIALIPPVLLAFLQFGWGSALIVLLGYLLINVLVNTLLTPRIMSQGLNISATLIFIALLFWAWVLGSVGIFMAVPLLIMIKIMAEHFDDTKWLATAMSEKVVVQPESES